MSKRYPTLSNPFPLVGYNGPHYFCDREHELRALRSAITNGQNISLIARRRIGKSALLEHLRDTLEHARPKWRVIYLDLIKTSTLEDLYRLLATELYEARDSGILSKLKDLDFLSRLRMSVGINPVTQLPEVTFDLGQKEVKKSLSFLLSELANEQRVILVFDEFQQILAYPEPQTEGFIRSEMMRLPGVRFIFCGSDQHLLEEMFHHSARPFFNSTTGMTLGSIDADAYKTFIISHFSAFKRTISDEALDFILHIADGETYAVQKLCNAIFAMGYPKVTLPLAKEVFRQVLHELQHYGERIRALLQPDSVQFSVLKAVARTGPVDEITGKEFLELHNFHNPSSVLKAVKSLEGYQLVSRKINPDGKLAYYVNDALLKAWLNTLPV